MKILLLYCPAVFRQRNGTWNTREMRYIPTRLIALANYLQSKRISVQIVHLGVELDRDPGFAIDKFVQRNHYGLVGLNLDRHKAVNTCLSMAARIKKDNPQTFVVAEGLFAGAFAEALLKKSRYLDAVIKGDSEIPFNRLARELGSQRPQLEKVPNLCWKDNNRVQFNEQNYTLSRELLNSLDYGTVTSLRDHNAYQTLVADRPLFHLTPARGCNAGCSLCSDSAESQRALCRRENEIVQEAGAIFKNIKNAVNSGWKAFFLNIGPDKYREYYQPLFRRLRQEKLNISMTCRCCGLPSLDLIDDLAALPGGAEIELTPATFSERVRRLNKTPFYTNAELFYAVDLALTRRIRVSLHCGYFQPGEKAEDLLDSLSQVLELLRQYGTTVDVLYRPHALEPVTPLFRSSQASGMKLAVHKLDDYTVQVRRAALQGNTDNILLCWPEQYSINQVRALKHLVQFVNFARTAFPQTILNLGEQAGSYRHLVEDANEWLQVHRLRQRSIDSGDASVILNHLIERSGADSKAIVDNLRNERPEPLQGGSLILTGSLNY